MIGSYRKVLKSFLCKIISTMVLHLQLSYQRYNESPLSEHNKHNDGFGIIHLPYLEKYKTQHTDEIIK